MVALSWIALLYIGIFKWYQGERHAGLFFVMMVFGLWVSNALRQDRQASNRFKPRALDTFMTRAITLALCVSCAVAGIWSYREVRSQYSGAMETADFIRSHHLAASPIATAGLQAEALSPWLPRAHFWYAGPQQFATYTRWDRDWQSDAKLSDSEVIRRVQGRFLTAPHLLLIGGRALGDPASRGYKLIFQNSYNVFGHPEEVYFLYAPLDRAACAQAN
jgi:hypothetical protein